MMKMAKLAMMALVGLLFTASMAQAEGIMPFGSVRKQVWTMVRNEGFTGKKRIVRPGLTGLPRKDRAGTFTVTLTGAGAGIGGNRGPVAMGTVEVRRAGTDGLHAIGHFHRVETATVAAHK
jgi:hypothetical protein